jgi:hypothetical protein
MTCFIDWNAQHDDLCYTDSDFFPGWRAVVTMRSCRGSRAAPRIRERQTGDSQTVTYFPAAGHHARVCGLAVLVDAGGYPSYPLVRRGTLMRAASEPVV